MIETPNNAIKAEIEELEQQIKALQEKRDALKNQDWELNKKPIIEHFKAVLAERKMSECFALLNSWGFGKHSRNDNILAAKAIQRYIKKHNDTELEQAYKDWQDLK